jgi:ATP-dependent DNA ligase
MEKLNVNIVTFPMLAQDYKKYSNKLKFPCYIQPKLDGYRMIYDYTSDTIMSRTGKEFKVLKSSFLHNELKEFCKEYINKIGIKNVILDGELYVHDQEFNFENYGILRKTKSLSEQENVTLNKIEYHIYDIINADVFSKRHDQLVAANEIKNKFSKIKFVHTQTCLDMDDVKRFHSTFTEHNYEGSILRNKDGLYKTKARSMDLLKYKDFFDNEYEIVDYTFEKNTDGSADDNLIVWICKNTKGQTFNVRPKGTESERKVLYKKAQENINQFKGKQLWVKYFELTDAGIPRFPTTMRSSYNEYIRNLII